MTPAVFSETTKLSPRLTVPWARGKRYTRATCVRLICSTSTTRNRDLLRGYRQMWQVGRAADPCIVTIVTRWYSTRTHIHTHTYTHTHTHARTHAHTHTHTHTHTRVNAEFSSFHWPVRVTSDPLPLCTHYFDEAFVFTVDTSTSPDDRYYRLHTSTFLPLYSLMMLRRHLGPVTSPSYHVTLMPAVEDFSVKVSSIFYSVTPSERPEVRTP